MIAVVALTAGATGFVLALLAMGWRDTRLERDQDAAAVERWHDVAQALGGDR